MGMFAPNLVDCDLTGPAAGIAQSLGITSPVNVPNKVDQAAVSFVLDVEEGGFSKAELLSGDTGNVAVNGVASYDKPLIGPNGLTVSGQTPQVTTSEQNARPLAMHANVSFNAAGAAAFAGKVLVFEWSLWNPSASPAVGAARVQQEYFTVAATRLVYRSVVRPADVNFIDWRLGLLVNVSVEDGTVFPASTVFRTIGYFTARKRGAMVPS